MQPAGRVTLPVLVAGARKSPWPARARDERVPEEGLVAVTPDTATGRLAPRPVDRSRAGFVSQLFATHQGLPQTRARRRAGPAEAAAAYAATARRASGVPRQASLACLA